jgi:hypothetical protein
VRTCLYLRGIGCIADRGADKVEVSAPTPAGRPTGTPCRHMVTQHMHKRASRMQCLSLKSTTRPRITSGNIKMGNITVMEVLVS